MIIPSKSNIHVYMYQKSHVKTSLQTYNSSQRLFQNHVLNSGILICPLSMRIVKEVHLEFDVDNTWSSFLQKDLLEVAISLRKETYTEVFKFRS